MKMKTAAMTLMLLTAPMVNAQNEAARVDVQLGDISQMRETKHMRGMQLRDTTQAIERLGVWLQRQAERVVPPEQTLKVTLRDVDLAGDYEPGPANMYDIRVIKEIYPPRIELDYQLSDAAGNVLRQGKTTLRDIGFMMGASAAHASDPLRFEKRLLNDWLRSLELVGQ